MACPRRRLAHLSAVLRPANAAAAERIDPAPEPEPESPWAPAGLWGTLGAPQTMTADERRYYYEHGYLSLANAITPVRPCSLPAVPLCRTH